MHLAVDGVLAAVLAVADPVKKTTPQALASLRAEGLRVVMATGDGLTTAKAVAARKKLEAELRAARKDELASYSPKKITDRRTRLKYLLRQQQDMDHENDPSYGNADNAADNHHLLMLEFSWELSDFSLFYFFCMRGHFLS